MGSVEYFFSIYMFIFIKVGCLLKIKNLQTHLYFIVTKYL